ncbi:MAG TPA: penicillin-binding transpeptidase domain-containing protein [Solirubrobacteraceae bacterium]|nr:penicillin-binding transpeptidase domain-containing protein [Solirubrobacteraceae bacterium]
MNGPIAKLFGVVVLLFALLIVWTSRWTVFEASSLAANPLNKRTLVDALRIKRGRILADDGTVLARSVRAPGQTWSRTYPTGSLFAQPVGYFNALQGQAFGLERSRGPELQGLQTGLSSVFGPLGGSQRVGDDVYTTLDAKAQRLAVQLLAGRAGAVVAITPRTGAVKVLYGSPSYDDNHYNPATTSTFDRATQSSYPPGSTFKIVTATAAIDSGRFTPNSTLDGKSPQIVSGVPLHNDNNQSFGPIDLTTALTYSVNTVWAQVAERLGRATMTTYMKRFGFYAKPPLDLPRGELNFSSVARPTRGYFPPGSPDEDIGRIAIGQGGLLVTPLQMAMVAAAVANGGTLMTPRLTDRVVDKDGRTVETISPTVFHHVMRPSAAAEVAQMMKKVVDEGTGTAAQLGSGITFAGKTGTASVGATGSNLTQPWFIGFAPIDNPKVAIAVTIERTQGQFGGQVAAPIARQIVQTLLAEGQ